MSDINFWCSYRFRPMPGLQDNYVWTIRNCDPSGELTVEVRSDFVPESSSLTFCPLSEFERMVHYGILTPMEDDDG